MNVRIDSGSCIGCSLCSSLCPQMFGLTDKAKAFACIFPIPDELRDPCIEAAEQCPAVAISFEP